LGKQCLNPAISKIGGLFFSYTAHAQTIKKYKGFDTFEWRGIFHGDSIEVKYHWSKKGWLSDTGKDYPFNGTLKQ